MTRGRILVIAALAVLSALVPRSAAAATRHYLIAIGNNERPDRGGHGSDDDVADLRYADDDAASMVSFWRELGAETELLTVLDADSQRRFPALAREAQPPTLARLREVVASLRRRFDADRLAGNDPVLVFYYSGHGSVKTGEDPSLTMLDGHLPEHEHDGPGVAVEEAPFDLVRALLKPGAEDLARTNYSFSISLVGGPDWQQASALTRWQFRMDANALVDEQRAQVAN